MSQPISTRMPAVVVEYDCHAHRVAKHFTNAYQARRFYVAKFNAGRSPRVRSPESFSENFSKHGE